MFCPICNTDPCVILPDEARIPEGYERYSSYLYKSTFGENGKLQDHVSDGKLLQVYMHAVALGLESVDNDPPERNDDRRPSQVTNDYWIYAYRQQGFYPEGTEEGSGKWMVFVPRDKVDSMWHIIAEAVRQGRLGRSAKVATARPNRNAINPNEHVICVYTYNHEDVEDVMRIRATLRELGITWKIPYKTDSATRAGLYQVRGHTRISKYYE